uniref:C2H2-type domain-containing protein n=1 Tax=Cyprinus carpio TaxID=7962 RepID=A0A8C2JFU1_CYPCA
MTSHFPFLFLGYWPFRSEDCSEAFGNKEDYLGHHSEHIHDGPIVCLDTDSQWDDLLISTDGGRRTLFCALCGQKFSSSKGFFSHQLKHRKQAIKQGIGEGARFSTSCSEGKVKEQIKHPFVCSECGKTYVSSVALLCHQRWHKRRAQLGCSDQPYKCTECGKVFTSLTFYSKHQRLAHSKELPAKSFLHQVIQLKKKAFECEECGRRFSRASALQSHQLCHTDVFRDIMEKKSEMSTATQPVKIYQNDNADSVVFHSQDIPYAPVQ